MIQLVEIWIYKSYYHTSCHTVIIITVRNPTLNLLLCWTTCLNRKSKMVMSVLLFKLFFYCIILEDFGSAETYPVVILSVSGKCETPNQNGSKTHENLFIIFIWYHRIIIFEFWQHIKFYKIVRKRKMNILY